MESALLRIIFLVLASLPLWSATLPAATAAPGPAAGQFPATDPRRILPRSEPWEKWLEQSQATPPSFEDLPESAFLPDPLRFSDGKRVKVEDWPRRRQELLELFQYYVFGKLPPSPETVQAADIKSHQEPGALVDLITLQFGPENRARLHLELILPRGQTPPMPVFVTQDNHRDWAMVAVSRGYIGCVYAGADSRDDTGAWTTVWPKQDWSKLARRAWAASRCIDYLHTLPMVDTNRIALAGHSANGKAALIAAAVDRRINAVIASSSGAGGACSWRFFSETQFGEGIELITRNFSDWFHPRLRFFAGRENRLPVDQPELLACIAPRSCLISSALNDPAESIWAIEQSYRSALPVWEMLGRGEELNLRYRPGGHETRTEDIEGYLDWLDIVFGRGDFPVPDAVIFPTFAMWQRLSGEQIDVSKYPTNGLGPLLVGPNRRPMTDMAQWLEKREAIRERIMWGLGEAPPFAENKAGTQGAEPVHTALLLERGSVPAGLQKQSIRFGNCLAGDVYSVSNADKSGKRMPACVWLHPISISNGYVPGQRRGEPPHLALARQGFVVFAFDRIGNGSRIQEVRNFYFRYPHWSLLGKDVEDTMAAVEALTQLAYVDAKRIFLLGYGTGGMVALHAAALDERVAGVVSVAGFTPMRPDTLEKGTGGIARWSQWLPLQPRLSIFIGQESRIPYDYQEVLAMVAPRPVMIFAPAVDYHSTLADITSCVNQAGLIFQWLGAPGSLQFSVLNDYNHFSPESQQAVFDRFRALAGM